MQSLVDLAEAVSLESKFLALSLDLSVLLDNPSQILLQDQNLGVAAL